MKTVTTKICSALFIACLLNACGGSDDDDIIGGGSGGGDSGLSYQGSDSPAQINSTNAAEIGKTSGEAILQASAASALPTAIEASEQIDLTPIHLSVIEASQSLSVLPSGVDVSQICTGGGSADADTGSNGNVQTLTYNNCTLSSGSYSFTIDGKVVLEYDNILNSNTSFSISYQNVTVSGVSTETVTLNYTWSCTNLSDYQTCTSSSVFTGADGNTHQVSNFEINGSATYGYDGTATFNHYSYGSVSVTVNNLTYGSCNGLPDGGTISFSSSAGSSGSISFHSDCSVSGTWNSGTDSGSF